MSPSATGVDRSRLAQLLGQEGARFVERNPRSQQRHDEACEVLLHGVPMQWMTMWPGGFPVFVAQASGARLWDIDGHEYVDFCLGDTAAMAGHAPEATATVVERQFRAGATAMLPSDDALWVGRELSRRFGLDLWQFALSATDANRWLLRIARHVTGRKKVLVFNHNYHGTVDEVNLVIGENGNPRTRANNLGPPVDPRQTTKVVEWNDAAALAAALAPEDVACVLAEPALTNIGIVPPEPGFHDVLRELTRSTGTLLILDETHTFSAGPGGCTAEYGLHPDAITLGKAIAGGIPIGAYGMTHELASRLADIPVPLEDTGMIGGTLAGNALSMAACRATLEHVLNDEGFGHMRRLTQIYVNEVRQLITEWRLPWHIVQLGARAEFRFRADPPRTGAASAAATDVDLDAYFHLYLTNRGVLLTPFHNMALMCPQTSEEDVECLVATFTGAVDELVTA